MRRWRDRGGLIDWMVARLLQHRWGTACCGACGSCMICDAQPDDSWHVQHSPGCPGHHPARPLDSEAPDGF